jgi:phosphoribosylamine--glycine ligase
MHVLVLGSGGREHALAWAIKKSPQKPKVTCAPGNAGTESLGDNADLDLNEHAEIIDFCKDKKVDLTVIGPENLLFDGLADVLRKEGIRVFGPGRKAAMLESSKIFAKEFLRRHEIPTADFFVFTKPDNAHKYIDKSGLEEFVVKADGPAMGKGAMVCDDPIDAHAAVDTCLIDRKFGAAGDKIVVEERLHGFETTLLTLVSGRDFIKLPYSQDHKRAFDGDKGPNTGGMGVFAPTPKVDTALDWEITEKIVKPSIEAIAKENLNYQGCLYFGLIITDDGPRLIEFNCRFGDPETQAVVPLLEGDFLKALDTCAGGSLKGVDLTSSGRKAISIVLASKGYPDKYAKGVDITDDVTALEDNENLIVFHAGTRRDRGKVLTSGGRVIAVTAAAGSFADAKSIVYDAIQARKFDGLFYRKDIGREL